MGDPASEQFSLRWNNFYTNLTSEFHALLQGEDLVDVTIAVDGKFVQAHKIVLSVCSPYFKDLFKVNPCKHPIVILKDVGYKELSGLLQFMYKGEVNVCQEELADFLKTAELLQIKGLTSSETQDSPKSRKRSITPELKKRNTPSSLQNQLKRKRMDTTDLHRPSSPNIDNLVRIDSKHSLLPPVPKMEPVDYSEGEDYETQEANNDLLSNIAAGETSRPMSATLKQGQRMFANFSQDLTDGTQDEIRQIGLRFQCPECSKHFSRRDNLQTHISDIHGDGRGPFTCPICNKLTKNRTSLRSHMYTNHKPVAGVFNKTKTSNTQSWIGFSSFNSRNSAQSGSDTEKEERKQFSLNINSKITDQELS